MGAVVFSHHTALFVRIDIFHEGVYMLIIHRYINLILQHLSLAKWCQHLSVMQRTQMSYVAFVLFPVLKTTGLMVWCYSSGRPSSIGS